MADTHTDEWIMQMALMAFVKIGGIVSEDTMLVLEHPEGRSKMNTDGCVMFHTRDSKTGMVTQVYVVFPWQVATINANKDMRNRYVVKVIAGTVCSFLQEDATVISPYLHKGYLTLDADKMYQFGARDTGVVFVGVSKPPLCSFAPVDQRTAYHMTRYAPHMFKGPPTDEFETEFAEALPCMRDRDPGVVNLEKHRLDALDMFNAREKKTTTQEEDSFCCLL